MSLYLWPPGESVQLTWLKKPYPTVSYDADPFHKQEGVNPFSKLMNFNPNRDFQPTIPDREKYQFVQRLINELHQDKRSDEVNLTKATGYEYSLLYNEIHKIERKISELKVFQGTLPYLAQGVGACTIA